MSSGVSCLWSSDTRVLVTEHVMGPPTYVFDEFQSIWKVSQNWSLGKTLLFWWLKAGSSNGCWSICWLSEWCWDVETQDVVEMIISNVRGQQWGSVNHLLPPHCLNPQYCVIVNTGHETIFNDHVLNKISLQHSTLTTFTFCFEGSCRRVVNYFLLLTYLQASLWLKNLWRKGLSWLCLMLKYLSIINEFYLSDYWDHFLSSSGSPYMINILKLIPFINFRKPW